VRKIIPKTVDLTFTRMHGGKPWMASFGSPFIQAAGADRARIASAGLHAWWIDSGRVDVSRGARPAVGCPASACRTNAHAERKLDLSTSTTASSRRRTYMRRSRTRWCG
jgi:hypothetical protein